MNTELFLFTLSLLICGIILYILGLLWFADTRNRQLNSLFLLGVVVCLWTLLNAVVMVLDRAYFPFVYTLRMMMVCALPYSFFWFYLNFTSSPLVHVRPLRAALLIIPAADILVLVTNPLHHLYFTAYDYPKSPAGPLFWVHTVLAYVAVLLAFLVLFRYIIRNVRKNKYVLAAGIFTIFPYALNMFFTLGENDLQHDITPIGFFFTFMVFAFFSYRSRLFNFKTTALSNLFASLKDCIMIADQEDIIIDVNMALLSAFPDFEVEIGKTPVHVFADYLKGKVSHSEPESALDKTYENFTGAKITMQTDGGQVRTYTMAKQGIFVRSRLSGYVLTLSDVSTYYSMIEEINAQNERLVELKDLAESASKAKSSFLANMSHEIRTPMNAIIGMDDLLMRTELSATQQGYAENIHAAATSLLSIINDILDFSKIESGKYDFTIAPYDLEAMLQDVYTVIAARMGDSSISFLMELQPGLPQRLVGDEVRVRQVLINLLSNAAKFTREGFMRLRVSYAPAGDGQLRISFEVEDSGMGMPREYLPQLFSAFQQVDTRKNRAIEGTGLGLAISHNLVKLMGGDITVESELGKGSVFTATILQDVGEGEPPRLEQAPSALHVLLCGKDPYRLDSIKNMCWVREIAVEVCEQNEQLPALLRAHRFTHILATSLFAEQLAALDTQGALVAIVRMPFELLEGSKQAGQYSLPMPLLPGAVYAFFNGAPLSETGTVTREDMCFTAPDARVLVVDDNELNRQVALGLLAEYALQLDSVEDGYRAIEMVRLHRYDLVFMDHMMPGMDGVDAARIIRESTDPYMQSLPIVALTANAITGMKEFFVQSGMNDYMSKPISPQQLRRVLLTWLPAEKIRQGRGVEEATSRAQLQESTQPGAEGAPQATEQPFLDISVVKRMFGGNERLYVRIVKKFMEGAEENLAFIHDVFSKGDIARFVIEVHGVKGAAANLGANPLSEAAKELELLGKAGDTTAIEARLPMFEKRYRDTLAYMERMGY